MTYLYNDPVDFADELIDGFVAANAPWVRKVAGGVVRSTGTPAGEVAIIVGGGSGHYPAFAGLVGPGLAHGAAMGNLFASPSAQQVYSVAIAAHGGAGVLLLYGNYAGDVLNFDQAQARLIAEGIPCSTVVITDDIASASVVETAKRRGIAGDLTVFKIAAAAAEARSSLEQIVELAQRANGRTRSLGVAFTGCTLPGATAPLFTVPAGRMAVGMGIHGEPGIDEVAIPSADGLAQLLVSALLAELPAGFDSPQGQRAAVILNGLGSVKYEELFVTYRSVARILADAGVTIIEPEVGELVTSFQMAGVSLTLFWLDDDLERLWSAPCSTPAYRKGTVDRAAIAASVIHDAVAATAVIPVASSASKDAATVIMTLLSALKETIDENVDELGRLDAVAGDGDHGIGMQRGATAAVAAAGSALILGAGAGTLLTLAGDAWADRAGGTSGALWGRALHAVGDAFGDENTPGSTDVVRGIADAQAAIVQFGKAQLGDKTMLDSLGPFSAALAAAAGSGCSVTEAWGRATPVAEEAAKATASMVPKIGRARPHASKSVGTADPGAVSMALIIRSINTILTTRGATQ